MNLQEEIKQIDIKLIDLRKRYVVSTPNRRRFIIVLANALKDKQQRLKNSLGNQMILGIDKM